MSQASYQFGRLIARHRALVAVGLVVVVAGAVFLNRSGESGASTARGQERMEAAEAEASARARANYEVREAKRLAELNAACASNGPKHTQAAAEAKRGRHQQAFEILYDCRNNLTDAPVKALFDRSMGLARKEMDAEAKRVVAAEKAARKKLGVRIGMSQQDVLDSSWGRPADINRTTTSRGTREQWVYGNGNYLYFDEGILTAIQN